MIVINAFLTFFFFLKKGLLCDLLWADPDKDTAGWSENDRGLSFTFGTDVSNLGVIRTREVGL